MQGKRWYDKQSYSDKAVWSIWCNPDDIYIKPAQKPSRTKLYTNLVSYKTSTANQAETTTNKETVTITVTTAVRTVTTPNRSKEFVKYWILNIVHVIVS